MKSILCLIFVPILWINCNNGQKVDNMNMISKQVSPIIIKDGSFIFIQLSVIPISGNEIVADISYKNKSTDSLLLYKALLPIENKLEDNIFSIFENESLEPVKYTGVKKEQYVKMAEEEDETVIKPNLSPDKFFILKSGETISFRINLCDFYDFKEFRSSSNFSITPSSYLPAVSSDYKQIFEKDTLDGKLKPVYYDISLPKNQSIDSMRVEFGFHK